MRPSTGGRGRKKRWPKPARKLRRAALVVTVVQAYYGLVVAQRKYATAQRAADEAAHFFDITQKLERGGEVAHSDSIKAQLQEQQQQRVLQDAELEMERSRLDLAVMIFPNFNENFTTVDDLGKHRAAAVVSGG